MNKHINKLLLYIPVFLSLLLITTSKASGQQPLHDSLRHMLTSLQNSIKDEKVKLVIKEIQTNYTSDTINSLLAGRLLYIDSILVNDLQFSELITCSYPEILTKLFKHFSGKEGNLIYANSLENLSLCYANKGADDIALPLCLNTLDIKKIY